MSSNVSVGDLCPHSTGLPSMGTDQLNMSHTILMATTPSEPSIASLASLDHMYPLTPLTTGATIVQIDGSHPNQFTLFETNGPNISQTLLSSNDFVHFQLQSHTSDDNHWPSVCDQFVANSQTSAELLTTEITVCSDLDVDNDWDSADFVKTDDNRFKCSQCSVQLNRLQDMRQHFRKHAEDKPFKCFCGQQFNFEINLRLHACGQHYEQSDDDSKRICCECHKCFTRLASLRSHLAVHEKEELLSCGHCSQHFSSHYNLNKHVKTVHMNGIRRQTPKARHKSQALRDDCVCAHCQQKFPNMTQLREHERLHLKIKSSLKHRLYNKCVDRSGFAHECTVCGKTFKKNSQLIRHKRIHTGEKPFVCDVCGMAFNQKNSLEIHRTKHTGERRFRCRFCAAQFNQSGNMRSHIRRLHAPQADTPASQLFKCPFCNCVFKKLGILNCHISRRHPSEATNQLTAANTKPIDANDKPLANNSLPMADTLDDLLTKALQKSGVRANGQSGEQQIAQLFDPATGARQTHIVRRVGNINYRQCLYCEKEFKKTSDLIRHLRIHTHSRPFRCSQCYRTFTVKGTLTAHMRTHEGLKPYLCQVCDKSFATSQSLKIHIRIHTGAQPYACPQCGKTFRTAGHLKSHSNSHQKQSLTTGADGTVSLLAHSKSGRTADVDQTLLSRIQLEGPVLVDNPDSGEHQTMTTNQRCDPFVSATEEGVEKRKFKCTHCGKAFKKSSHLTQHTRSHTGEKPFQCDICLQCFVAKGSLKIHLQTHSGVKPFKCTECEYSFATNGSLTRHMTRHRDVRPFMCPYCQKTFKSSINCKKHLKVHKKEFALQLMAEQSKYDGPQQEAHPVVEHSEEIVVNTGGQCPESLPHVCQSCGQSFKKPSQLKQHSLQHTDQSQPLVSTHMKPFSTVKNYSCDICLASFVTNSSLQRHLKTVHAIQALVCSHCSQRCDTRTALNQHVNDKHRDSAQSLLKTALDGSERIDVLVKDLTQTITNRNIASAERQSISSSNSFKDIHPNVCDFCTKSFKKPSDLLRHRRTHTGEKPFVCDICQKRFAVKSTLGCHLATHKDEKKFRCNVCDVLFATNGSLKVHKRLHSGQKPFKCDECDQTFRTSGHRKTHLEKHKKNKIKDMTSLTTSEDQMIATTNTTGDEQLIDGASLGVPELGVMRIELTSDPNAAVGQTVLPLELTQLFQLDPNLMQQLQSQGIIITECEANDIETALTVGADNVLF